MNKIKTLYDSEAFKATEGRTIANISKDYNSIHIYFADKSYINIEVSSNSGPCSCVDYCYCTSEVDISSYFSEEK